MERQYSVCWIPSIGRRVTMDVLSVASSRAPTGEGLIVVEWSLTTGEREKI